MSSLVSANNVDFLIRQIDNHRVCIVDVVNDSIKHLQIPKNIKGKIVTEIGDGAFAGKGIESLVLPGTLETIGKNAFSGNKIEALTLPESVSFLKDEAFSNNNIKTLHLSKKIAYIGDRSFDGNPIKMNTLVISQKINYIGKLAFVPEKIQTVLMEGSPEAIDDFAFQDIDRFFFSKPIKKLGYNSLGRPKQIYISEEKNKDHFSYYSKFFDVPLNTLTNDEMNNFFSVLRVLT